MQNEARLLKYLEEITLEALKIVATVTNEAQANAAIQRIHYMLDQFGYTVEQVVPGELLIDYFNSVDAATTELIKQGVQVEATRALTPDGLISKPFQKVVHLRAVENLIDDTMMDLRAAIRTAKLSSSDSITTALNAVNRDLSRGLITGEARRTTSARVMQSFYDNGMTAFITSDGKKLPLRFYAQTVTRTKTRTATLEGSRNRWQDIGHDLVKINGNGDSCIVCARFHGMVVSLTGKTAGYPVVGGDIMLPPYHPNCRCSETVFIPFYASPEEVAAVKARNDEFDPVKDRRSPADKAAYEHEQRLRRQANEEMKQWMRWQNGLGADAPKTLGAFRRMKRENTPKFQELQSNYLSWAHTKK